MASFEERILAMERELRDLKTAHNRGLGIITFYESAETPPTSSTFGWWLRATGGNRNLFPFIAQIAVSDRSMHWLSTRPTEVDPETNSITWHFNPTDTASGGHAKVKVVSTDDLSLRSDLEMSNEYTS